MDETRSADRIQGPETPFSAAGETNPREILRVDRLRAAVIAGQREVLSGISFSIAEKEIFAVAGQSGCGKSTLACALTGLLPPQTHRIDGRVFFQGADVLAMSESARRDLLRSGIRYLFQEPGQALNPIARIGKQMHYAFDGTNGSGDRFHALLTSFGLAGHGALMRAYPHELSIGTLQRILLAAALAPRPALLVADEPTSSIDFVLKHMLMEQLQQLCAADGMAVIFITHDLPLARRYAGRLSVLSDGRLVQEN